jgi:predicted permease
MDWLRALAARVRALVRRDVIAGEIRDELDFHLQSRIEHFERGGLTPVEARRAARQRVGNLAVYQDRGYDVRGGGLMETIWQDVRYAGRMLKRQPGFTLVAVLTLALGIGASTAIFSVIDAALLRPLPYPHPEQLVEVEIRVERSDRAGASHGWPRAGEVKQIRQRGSPLSAVAASIAETFERVLDTGELERTGAISISDTYLAVLGLSPAAGRSFTADDTRVGAPAVAMLGFGVWQRQYGGDPAAVGRTITFDGRPATIVGVMPRNAEDYGVWLPLPLRTDEARTVGDMIGRLRPGITREDAERQLSAAVSPRPAPAGITQKTSVRLTPLLDRTTRGYHQAIAVLSAAVIVVLLLGCVNVAALLLARGAARQSELAVRAAIGAGRSRLVRQLLCESFVLAAAGGAAGVLLAWLLIDSLVANLPIALPSNSPAEMNIVVLAAGLGLALITGGVVGLVPAFRLSRVPLTLALGRGFRGAGAPLTRRGGGVVIAAEIALAVILLAGAGVMLRSFNRLIGIDLGFDPDAVVTLEATPVDRNPAVHGDFYRQLLRTLREMPDIEAAGAIDHFPLGGSGFASVAAVNGAEVTVGVSQVLPGYFEAMAIPLRAGRLLTDGDVAAGMSAALVNETAARQLFPGASPVGQQITVQKLTYTIVGVVADVGIVSGRCCDLLFLPFDPRRQNGSTRWLTVVVRPRNESTDLADRLRQAALTIGPRVLVERIRPVGDWLGDRVAMPRRRTVLIGLLGGLGLVLAVVGVFGMTAYSVARRTREIGVRMAFGAAPGAIVGRMLRDAAIPIGIGTAVGLAAAALSTRLIASFLYQTQPTDPATFAAVAALLVSTGCLAALVPAMRAARVDPLAALRSD